MTKANGANFWEEMSSAGVGKNEEKNDNLSSSDVIVFPHILSNTGSQPAAEAEASSGYIFSCIFMHDRGKSKLYRLIIVHCITQYYA